MAGDIPLDAVFVRVVEVCKKILKGANLFVCCRSGIYRSALIYLILLIFISDCKPGVIADYLQRLRNIIDI